MLKIIAFLQSRLHHITPITACYIAGIWWQSSTTPFEYSYVISLALVAILTVRNKLSQRHLLQTTTLSCAFFAGALLFFIQQEKHATNQTAFCGGLRNIRGCIMELNEPKQRFFKNSVTLNTYLIHKDKEWKPVNAKVQIYTDSINKFLVGDTIEIKDIIFKKPIDPSFNFYLMKQGITATTHQKNLEFKLIHRPKLSLQRAVFYSKKNIFERLKKKISPNVFPLVSSVFFGLKSGRKHFLDRLKELFKAWGILHFLARSGLHLVIFIFLWNIIIRFIPIAFIFRQILFIFLGAIYCGLTWTSIPFIRAISIFFLYKIGPLLNARTNTTHLLAIICLMMLLNNPSLLFFLDFQLSFGLTFALAWFGQLKLQKRTLLQNY